MHVVDAVPVRIWSRGGSSLVVDVYWPYRSNELDRQLSSGKEDLNGMVFTFRGRLEGLEKIQCSVLGALTRRFS